MLGIGIISWMLIIALIGAILTYGFGKKDELVGKSIGIGFTIVLFVLALYLWISANPIGDGFLFSENITWIPSVGINYSVGVDGISLPLVLATTLLTMLAALGSWSMISSRIAQYYGLLLILEMGLLGVFVSLNLIVFFLFWELVLVPMFLLIGIWGGPNRKYAAMKFIIFTNAGSSLMFIGFILLFLAATPHTFDFLILMDTKIAKPLQLIIMITTFFGFAVKLPVVPLHTWLLDAHVEAPAPISVLLAGVLLKMGGYGFIRINLSLFPEISFEYAYFFIGLALLTIFYGAGVALVQRDLKMMIALTSINHMGFVLLGAFTGNLLGLSGAVFQMFNHACAVGLLFLLSGVIQHNAGTREIDKLSDMLHTMPRTTALFVFGALAALGFPFLSSFVSEFMIFMGAINAFSFTAIVVLAPGIVTAYFVWTIDRIVLRPKNQVQIANHEPHEGKLIELISVALFVIPIVILGLFPSLMLQTIVPSCQKLLENI
ncbi:NADH-quinone oxidoreductase subunit M [Candidatus Borrarchaeum sp.]|uniref:complex I subunit 4 family protein n=1 Tax=Candidatus Borrarchaeum sp. TaxID=2846742 RepID=UPI002579A7F1|nr:NADH-quinone oxidoreductase subunit M [Candidatus Borrarchaeum sp.]